MENYVKKAKDLGFHDAAILDVSKLIVVPEYRKYCEDNLCGNYGKLDACPPVSGTVDEMISDMRRYDKALILNTTVSMKDINNMEEHKKAKKNHNHITEKMLEILKNDGRENVLMMGAGPWKHYSCMSAYCVDAQKMASEVEMKCWENDGKTRYFSLLLFNQETKI